MIIITRRKKKKIVNICIKREALKNIKQKRRRSREELRAIMKYNRTITR